MAEKSNFGSVQNLRVLLNDLVSAGKNPFDIILEIAKLLGEMSGETNYYRSIREQIGAVYGLALNDKHVLEAEIDDITARIAKIELAYGNETFSEDEHARIGFALERHKAELEHLKMLKDSGVE